MGERVLVLVRHAKSEQDAATDIERRLTERGHRDAATAGKWLAEQAVVPDLVVVSPAMRARQTWDEIAKTVRAREQVIDERLYDNTAADLLDILRAVADEVTTVMLVGHNPSMHAVAAALDDGAGDQAARRALHDGYPTCGVAVFDHTGGWTEVGPGTGTVRAFAAPRG